MLAKNKQKKYCISNVKSNTLINFLNNNENPKSILTLLLQKIRKQNPVNQVNKSWKIGNGTVNLEIGYNNVTNIIVDSISLQELGFVIKGRTIIGIPQD